MQLVLAPVTRQQRIADDVDQLLSDLVAEPGHDLGQNAGADLRRHRARVLVDAVACGDVADLVAEHGGELGLVLDVGHDAAGDVDVAARQREGVDLVAVEYRESVLKVRTVALFRQSRSPTRCT